MGIDRHLSGGTPRGGQAMTEFIVGLLVVVILVSGTLTWIEIASARSELLGRVRGATGRSAMLGGGVAPAPPFPQTWEEGPDRRRYTADDRPVAAGAAGLRNRIVARAVRDPADWQRIEAAGGDLLSDLRTGTPSGEAVGLVRGRESRIVVLSPALRALVYDKPEVTVAAEIWMPRMGGLRR